MLKPQSLREMTRDELTHKRNELMDEIFNLNMRRSLKALDNPVRLRIIRREIARINTVLREDDLGVRRLAEGTVGLRAVESKSGKGTDK